MNERETGSMSLGYIRYTFPFGDFQAGGVGFVNVLVGSLAGWLLGWRGRICLLHSRYYCFSAEKKRRCFPLEECVVLHKYTNNGIRQSGDRLHRGGGNGACEKALES